MASKATPDAKEKFVKAVLAFVRSLNLALRDVLMHDFSSRSLKRTRDAAQQFTLVARGLEGSGFGYASLSM